MARVSVDTLTCLPLVSSSQVLFSLPRIWAECNGRFDSNLAQSNTRDWLKHHRGAYTTMRSVHQKGVFQWSFHCNRMAESVKLISLRQLTELGVANPAPEHHVVPTLRWMFEPGNMRRLMDIAVSNALENFLSLNHDLPESEEIKILITITWDESNLLTSPLAAAPSTDMQLSVETEQSVVSLDSFTVNCKQLHLMLNNQPLPVSLFLHLSPLGTDMRQPRDNHHTILIAESHRTNASAKDSQWVRDAEQLEQSKPSDCNEICFHTAGEMLEGISSNFFALVQHDCRLEFQTAEHGILKGTVRDIVLEQAQRPLTDAERVTLSRTAQQFFPLQIQLQPPRISDLSLWRAAFISSTSRLLLPVDRLYVQHATDRQTVQFDFSGDIGQVVRLLEDRVKVHFVEHSEPVLKN